MPNAVTAACRQLRSLGQLRVGHDYYAQRCHHCLSAIEVVRTSSLANPSASGGRVTTACRQLRSLGHSTSLLRPPAMATCHHCLSAIEVVRTHHHALKATPLKGVTTACRQLRSLGPVRRGQHRRPVFVTTACRQLRSLGLGRRLRSGPRRRKSPLPVGN